MVNVTVAVMAPWSTSYSTIELIIPDLGSISKLAAVGVAGDQRAHEEYFYTKKIYFPVILAKMK